MNSRQAVVTPVARPTGAPVSAFHLNRLTLRFADAVVEAAYAQQYAHKSVRPARIALLFAGAMTVAIYVAITRLLHHMDAAAASMLGNLAFMLMLTALAFASTYRPQFIRWQQAASLVLNCQFSWAIAWATSLGPLDVVASRGWGFMLLHTFSIYSLTRMRFPQATLAGWLGVAIYSGYMQSVAGLDADTLMRHVVTLGFGNLWGMLICYQMDVSARQEYVAMQLLGRERERSERLLRNILPAPIAERLKASDEVIAEHAAAVTVLFADIVGFTPLSARKTPQALVELLNQIFSEFDALADTHGLEKIKTIGDAYMAVAGLPTPHPDHAARAASMAMAMLDTTAQVSGKTGEVLALRIGLHSGPVVAGVIGRRKFTYDLWGDTVNTASRMEHHGLPGAVHCSESTAALLGDAFALQARGLVEIKGKGAMQTYLVSRMS
jgi:class 3 adenylate cyclase